MESRRTNGLHRPFHKLQISTWVLLPLLFIHYYVFLYPLLWESTVVKVVVTLFFVASSVALLCFGYLCCSTDPSDDALKDLSKGSPRTNNSVYCYICEVNVNKCSKHCRYCGKCVEGLDHHCKWLNTCVGTKNYKFFLAVLGSVTLTTTISVTLSIAYLVEIFAYASSFDVRIARLNGGSQSLDAVKYQAAIPSDGVKGVLIASIAILLPLVALIYQLVGFHIMLAIKGMTTHEFITLESRKARDNDEEEETSIEGRGSGDEIPPPAVEDLTEHGHVTKHVDFDYRRRRPSIQSNFMNDNDLVAKAAKERSNSVLSESLESPPEWAVSELNYESKENKRSFGYGGDKKLNTFCAAETLGLHDSISDAFYEQLKK